MDQVPLEKFLLTSGLVGSQKKSTLNDHFDHYNGQTRTTMSLISANNDAKLNIKVKIKDRRMNLSE